MSGHINSAMDAEVVESTLKRLRFATVTATEGGELFESFSATVESEGVPLESAVAEALQLYVDRHKAE